MINKPEIEAIEKRAYAVRRTIKEVCELAEVHPSSWSRIKRSGVVGVKTLRSMEDALTSLEAK